MSGLFAENEIHKCRIHHTGIRTWSDGVVMDGRVFLQGMNDELLFPKEMFMAVQECEGGLIQFEVDGKWGFADIYSGKIKIKPRWDYVGPFYNGYAHVGTGAQVNVDEYNILVEGGGHGYIDTKGETVIPLEYDDADEIALGQNFIVAKNAKWGLVNKDNALLIPLIWHRLLGSGLKGILYCSRKTENFECFYGVYDSNFNLIVEPVVEKIITPVLKDNPKSKEGRRYEKYRVLQIKRKYGIICHDGRLIANIVLSKKQAEMMLNTISRELSGIYIQPGSWGQFL